tara:strand:- start:292 stop:738 length:447 start_codon:yes stop_codon:yes gene_type:complete
MNSLSASLIDSMSQSNAEKAWMKIPILGVIISACLFRQKMIPIRRDIIKKLKNRDASDVRGEWGEDWNLVCRVNEIVDVNMGWSPPLFIKKDSFKIVFWAHLDGLDLVEAFQEIEDMFNVMFDENDLEYVEGESYGNFIGLLKSKIVA